MQGMSFPQRMAQKVLLAEGWARALIAGGAGAFAVLAIAPFHLFPAIAISMVIAVWLIDGCQGGSARAGGSRTAARNAWLAARIGWWFGFGYFLAGLWWLGAAFLVEADRFAWALPLGVVGLPAALAFFNAAGFAIASLLWSPGPARIFALAAGLGLSEWLRGLMFSGFPWNDFGMALGGNLVLAQSASLVGLHGLTFLTIAIAAAPATLIDRASGARKPYRPTFVAIGALVLIAAFGGWRLVAHPTAFSEAARLHVMQPNLPQDAKFRPEKGAEILEHYIASSRLEGLPESGEANARTFVFWPESAFPFLLTESPEALARIGEVLPDDVWLVTGAARRERRDGAAGDGWAYFNSILLLESDGSLAQTYDKRYLVPFGEYLPFARILDAVGLRQFVHVPGGFTAGQPHQRFTLPHVGPAAPLVCYEAIFPGALNACGTRPSLVVNVTNDGWFGATTGPHQHFSQARLRTIESGAPMVRVANTGISAIIDPYGRVLRRLPLGVNGTLTSKLPAPAGATIASCYRTYIGLLFFFLFLGLALMGVTRRRAVL